jgi:hypothetical protein
MSIINNKDENNQLVKQNEIETVKFRYSEGRIEIKNEYDITKPDGTNIKGTKTSINDYKILEGEGKVDEVSKKLDSFGKTPTFQLEHQALGENPETKIPEIIQASLEENPVKANQGAEVSQQKSEKAVEIPANPGATSNSDANGGESTFGGNN